MIQKINGHLVFTYGSPKKQYFQRKLKLSLVGILLGIFLLPQLAYLSTITPERIIELTNQERRSAGLNQLTSNQLLTEAAINKGKDILETNNFKHTINDKKFSAWIREAGYNYSYAGENLAIDFMTSEAVLDAWKKSALHKKNLLNPYYQEIGIGAVKGKFRGQDTILIVQIFGAPATAIAAPWNNSSETTLLDPAFEYDDLLNRQPLSYENLLAHSVLAQSDLPLQNNKIILPQSIMDLTPNKFVAQPSYLLTLTDYTIIFSLLSFIYLIFLLNYYYFLKIKKISTV